MSAFCPDGCPDGEAGPCVVGHPCALHPPVSAHDTPEVGSGETVGERVRCDTCGHADGLHVNCKAQSVNLLASPDPVQPADAGEARQVVLGQIGEHVEATGLSEAEVGEIGRAMRQSSGTGCWPSTPALEVVERILAAREAAWAEKYAAVVGERDALRELLRIGTELDNHHNADRCPYCIGGIAARAESAEAALATALREKAEDRARVEAVEAVLTDSTAVGYWSNGSTGWVRGIREDDLRAALAIPTAAGDE